MIQVNHSSYSFTEPLFKISPYNILYFAIGISYLYKVEIDWKILNIERALDFKDCMRTFNQGFLVLVCHEKLH